MAGLCTVGPAAVVAACAASLAAAWGRTKSTETLVKPVVTAECSLSANDFDWYVGVGGTEDDRSCGGVKNSVVLSDVGELSDL